MSLTIVAGIEEGARFKIRGAQERRADEGLGVEGKGYGVRG